MRGIRLYTPAELPSPDRREILRYAGERGEGTEILPLLEECIAELLPALTYRAVYTELPLGEENPYGFAHRLAGCESVILFMATVGLAPDRAVIRYGHSAPARALLCQAIGAERIEALCDALCAELAREAEAEGRALCPRFSPGYGDCPLTLQRELSEILETPKRIGVCVGESLLLTPTKSVSAIIGVRKKEEKEGGDLL